MPADASAAGFYLTNLHNDIIGNAASGGWSGFAMPVLMRPIGPHKDENKRPGNRLTKTFDGNTAHSTGWWWSSAGAFYSGGALFYADEEKTLLQYNAGRDQVNGNRWPCLVDKCTTGSNNCDSWCSAHERAYFRMTNSKVFLTASPALNSVSVWPRPGRERAPLPLPVSRLVVVSRAPAPRRCSLTFLACAALLCSGPAGGKSTALKVTPLVRVPS